MGLNLPPTLQMQREIMNLLRRDGELEDHRTG